MREIKARVWTGKEMVYYEHDIITPHYYDGLGKFLQQYCAGEIMEFTGLKDKNGKDIYEGDTVRWDNSESINGISNESTMEEDVWFAGGAFYPVCSMPSEEFEIVGNEFESSGI